jgi:hypothetical protein
MTYTPPTEALDAALDVAYASPDVMSAALTAAAPFIQAAALRDAADALDADPEFRDPLRLKSDWLRARAASIEGRESE